MNIMKSKQIIATAALLVVIALGHASVTFALSLDDSYPQPVLPAGCEQLAPPTGHEVAYHVYAVGVQIYRWNGSAWAFVAPEAGLFASRNFRGLIGTHYGGPTWESASGSKVVATVVDRAFPDADAMPWLLLKASSSEGPGIFDGVTFIQRVNTEGGLAPADPGEPAVPL